MGVWGRQGGSEKPRTAKERSGQKGNAKDLQGIVDPGLLLINL